LANRAVCEDDGNVHYHTVADPAKAETSRERGAGAPKNKCNRPGRKTHQRQQGKRKEEWQNVLT
jgi:hypothetical protein